MWLYLPYTCFTICNVPRQLSNLPRILLLGSDKAGIKTLAAQLRDHSFNDGIMQAETNTENTSKSHPHKIGTHVLWMLIRLTRSWFKAERLKYPTAPLLTGGDEPSENLESWAGLVQDII